MELLLLIVNCLGRLAQVVVGNSANNQYCSYCGELLEWNDDYDDDDWWCPECDWSDKVELTCTNENCTIQLVMWMCDDCGYTTSTNLPANYCYECRLIGQWVSCECGIYDGTTRYHSYHNKTAGCGSCNSTGKITTRACGGSCTSSHRYCTHYTTTTLTSHSYCSHGYTSQHL